MINFEIVATDWFDADALRLPAYRVGRVNYGNGRAYLRITDGQLEQPFRLYTSLTTAINTCAPMEDGLLQWYCRLGYEEANRYSKMAASYGTLMHIQVGKYLRQGYYDFTAHSDDVRDYIAEQRVTFIECKDWDNKLKYDIIAFIAFAQAHQIKPIGIEYVLLSDKGFGTLIDLVCKMRVEVKGDYGEVYKSGPRKGEPKETTEWVERTAVINFKSGRHAFYRSNGIQIECEKLLFEENFPDIKIDCALNWSPKEWIYEPGYKLKDWTGDITIEEVNAIIGLAQIRFGNKAMNKRYVDINGTAYSHRPVAEDCVKLYGVEQYCKDVYSDYL